MKKLKVILLIACSITGCSAQVKNGFDLEGELVPVAHILSGGPSKDGIPAIDNPHFVSPDKASFLKPDSLVLGMTHNGITKAYPISILNWHEIVNDQFNGEPVVITFCPLCGSGMVFSASIDSKALTFGVLGLLYNSDVLLYDRQTESLWSQLMSKAISRLIRSSNWNKAAIPFRTKSAKLWSLSVMTASTAPPRLSTRWAGNCPVSGLSGSPGTRSIRKPKFMLSPVHSEKRVKNNLLPRLSV